MCAQQAVTTAHHNAVDSSVVRHAESDGFGLVQDFSARRIFDAAGKPVHDADAAADRHAQPAAGVAVREPLFEIRRLHVMVVQELKGSGHLARKGPTVVQIGESAGNRRHQVDKIGIELARLGHSKPGTGVPCGAAPLRLRGPFDEGDSGRTSSRRRGVREADGGREPRSTHANHYEIVALFIHGCAIHLWLRAAS